MKGITVFNPTSKQLVILLALIFSGQSFAAPIISDFTQPVIQSSTTPWIPLNDACLTAGTSANNTTTTSNIPGCNYSPADAAGSGALRLTPASNNQTGAIISNFTFPSNQGLQVTFTTYTYGGDSGGTANDGADGIGFFLSNAGVLDSAGNPSIPVPTVTGGLGGSLGYSCSNGNSRYDGLANGYIGLGMDEYGNFLNSSDNTSTGVLNTHYSGVTSNGSNTFYSSVTHYQPNRIGLRGAGNINWAWLSSHYSSLYSGTESASAVKNTCKTGLLQNGSSGTQYYSVASSSPLSWASNILTVNTASQMPINVGDSITIGSTSSSSPPTSNGLSIAVTKPYVVTSVGTDSFSVSLPSGSNTFTNPTNAEVAINAMDYPIITNGYWVLPNGTLIANEASSSRSTAVPITYKLIITPTNVLTFMYSYNGANFQPVLTNQSLTASNGAMPLNFRFGFSGSTGGYDNIHEITCFEAQPLQSASSAAANTTQSGQVQTGTQVYLSGYDPNNWWGTLASYPLSVNAAGTLIIGQTARWDGGCELTGGGCSTTTVAIATPENPLPATGRQLLTWNGSAGAALEWASLTTAQQGILNSTDGAGLNRLNWLRGDRSQEQVATPPGLLRTRDSVLGDIIGSSPVLVGAPALNYPAPFTDALYDETTAPENATTPTAAETYSNYTTTQATRTLVVYSGSNDGFLHGFRSGSSNTDGSYNLTNYQASNNDGYEVIGFMPSTVLANSNVVGLTSPLYSHNYFVNAAPGQGDLFYGNAWHTWLVGGLGAGGAEIYALDITDPTQFSETNASSLVKGDWTNANLANLGNTYGTPLIRRLHNGQWALIFGNGFGSSTYHAGVYIGLIDSTTGAVTYQWLDTGAGSATNPDGINYVSSVDLDADHVTDYLYAGDLLGNVWRFDLTSSNPSDWAVSKFGNSVATPLFTAGISNGGTTTVQPITTSIAVASSFTGNAQRILIMFGTGQVIPATVTSPDTYATGTQTVYGIWDYDMNNWNNGVTTTNGVVIPASAIKYAALTAPQSISRANLLAQALASTTAGSTGNIVLGYRSISSSNNVCWQGSTACTPATGQTIANANNQYGWDFDLPSTNEQIIYNPTVISGALVVNTTIPPVSTAGQCTVAISSGWEMAFSVASGGGFPQGFFSNSAGNFSANSDGSTVMGVQVSGDTVGSVWSATLGATTYAISKVNSPTAINSSPGYITQINPQNGIVVKSVSWEELR